MELVIYFLVAVSVISHTTLYILQRRRRSLAQLSGSKELRTTLTPKWVLVWYWINFILLIVTTVLIFINLNKWWLLVFWVYILLGAPVFHALVGHFIMRSEHNK